MLCCMYPGASYVNHVHAHFVHKQQNVPLKCKCMILCFFRVSLHTLFTVVAMYIRVLTLDHAMQVLRLAVHIQ